MQITTIRLMKRKNLGNYEHEEAEVSVALDEGEATDEAISMAKHTIAKCLGIKLAKQETVPAKPVNTPAQEPVANDEAEVSEPAPKKTAKKATKKPAKKAVTKKAPAKKKEEEKTYSVEEVQGVLRATAKKLKSLDKVRALVKEVTGVDSVGEAHPETYAPLVKACEAL